MCVVPVQAGLGTHVPLSRSILQTPYSIINQIRCSRTCCSRPVCCLRVQPSYDRSVVAANCSRASCRSPGSHTLCGSQHALHQAGIRRPCLCRATADTPPSSSDGINSSSGPNPHADRVPEEAPDEITMEILSAQSWEDLYELFYNSGTAAPSHQHCYGYLIALSELLPELDAPPPFAVAAAGINVGSSSSSTSPEDLDKGWEALRAAGKVVSWNQLTALRVRAWAWGTPMWQGRS